MFLKINTVLPLLLGIFLWMTALGISCLSLCPSEGVLFRGYFWQSLSWLGKRIVPWMVHHAYFGHCFSLSWLGPVFPNLYQLSSIYWLNEPRPRPHIGRPNRDSTKVGWGDRHWCWKGIMTVDMGARLLGASIKVPIRFCFREKQNKTKKHKKSLVVSQADAGLLGCWWLRQGHRAGEEQRTAQLSWGNQGGCSCYVCWEVEFPKQTFVSWRKPFQFLESLSWLQISVCRLLGFLT